MPDNQQSVEIDSKTTTSGQLCSQCGVADCGHSTTTNDITGSVAAKRRKKKSEELPVELTEFAANYEVEGLIGEGGMSAVYKAHHRALNKPMAIKMLHAHLVRDVVQRKRFEQEAHALFLLEHPNIVKLRDFNFTSSGKPYLIMDFLEGRSLSDVLKANGPLPVQNALRFFVQVCDALEHAHSKSIIHRDIKPSNIVTVVGADGEMSVRIVDFGIAKFNQDEINPGLTQTGDVFGSPLYMSPEQCLGHKLDQRSDIYALGCVMYEALSGHPPLVGETALSTIHKHTSEAPKPLEVPNCNANLRTRLDEIIFKTLEKDPDKRYQSMSALRKDLAELLQDTGYRKGGGYYVRYARFYRRVLNIAKENPFKFLTCLTAFVLIVSFATYSFVERSESLFKAPVTLNQDLTWNWPTKPVQAVPVDFDDNLRQARFLVDNASDRLGAKDAHVIELQRKLAKFLIKFGYWDEAIETLKAAQKGYDATDPNVADIDRQIGEIYIQKKEWKAGIPYFESAMEGYKQFYSTSDNSPDTTKLLYGLSLLGEHRVSSALKQFESIRDDYGGSGEHLRFESVMALSGIADCDVAMAEVQKDPTKRAALLIHARGYYETANESWEKYSKHDQYLCGLRIADILILQNEWKRAADVYRDCLKQPELFNELETAKIEQNYARLLWRTGNVLEALRMDDEASLSAKRAASRISEQSIRRFKPNERR